MVLFTRKEKLQKLFKIKVLVGGAILEPINYGSLYLLITHINNSKYNSYTIFSIVNIGIAACFVFIDLSILREKLNKVNILGIVLAFIAIFILTN